MKEHLMILEMAAEGKLPEKIDSSSGLSVNVVQQLIDAGYLIKRLMLHHLMGWHTWNPVLRWLADSTSTNSQYRRIRWKGKNKEKKREKGDRFIL